MHVILSRMNVYKWVYRACLATQPYITVLILLQKKALGTYVEHHGTQNINFESKLLQIGPQILSNNAISICK